MSEYRKGEAVILTRNDNYWGGKPLLDKFVLRIIPDEQARIVALQTGEIDFTQVNPKYVPDLLSDTNLQLITKVVDMQYHFRLNTTKPALSDKRTRQALFLALDREAMLEALNMGYGQIADSPFNPVVSAYESKPIYSFNVDKANQLLQEVGWVKGSDGILVAENVAGVAKGTRFTLVLDAMSTEEQKIMTMAQSYWKDLGIDATIRQIDSNVWREENIGKVDKPYDVMYSGIGFIGNNGINYQWLMATTKKDSDMSYENPDVNALFEKAKTTEDVTQRDTYLKQAAAIVWDDLPFLPLYYDKRVFAANKNVHFEDSDWQVTMVGIFGKPGNIWKSK
jgi:peptide/nickel transport system substrate-binding protein